MNKSISLVITVAMLVVLTATACVPPTASSLPPTAAPTAVATPVVRVVATGTPPNRAPVPAPADDSRPLAKLSPAERNERFGAAAPISIKPNAIYEATLTTDKGKIVAQLYPDAPEGVNNFVTLAKNGFYDGLTFHRVEPGFVIQGGDPKGDGTGGPGYTIPAEIQHLHSRGALAWARTGDQVNPERRSSGSQFYITLADVPSLDGQYSVFGQVVEGLDVVDKIAVGDKIQRIDIQEAQASRLPTPAPTLTPSPTPLPKAPKLEQDRPLAKVPAADRGALYNTAPESVIKEGANYQATIKTPKGEVVIQLDAKTAPKAVSNFVLLANLGFYDAMPVAFVDPQLYLVSGSPASNPESDIGYTLLPEGTPQGSAIITGTVAMYPSFDQVTGDVTASGSQFFISLIAVQDNQTPLSVLGTVISGLDIVPTLTVSDTLTTVTITEK